MNSPKGSDNKTRRNTATAEAPASARSAGRELCREALENMQEAVAVCEAMPDGTFRYAYANRALLEHAGATLDGIRDRRPEEVFPPATAGKINAAQRRCLETGTVIRSEDTFMSPDRETVTAETVFSPMRDACGRISRILAVSRLAAGRKSTEEAPAESEHRLLALIDKMPLPVSIMHEGRLKYVNESFLRQFGYANFSELNGRDAAILVPPELRPMMKERDRQNRLQGMQAELFEVVGIKKDGTRFPALIAITRMELDEGAVNMVIGIDLSDRLRIETALKKSERRFRTLIDKAPFAIAIQREGRTEYVNDRYLQLYGYGSRDELRGKDALEMIAPEQRPLVAERQRLRAQGVGVPSEYESVGLRKDGSRFPFIIAVTRVELDEGMVSVVTNIDISDRKRAEAALKENEEKLRVILERSPAPISWTDRRGRIEYVNAKFRETFGYTLEDIPTVDAWLNRAYPDPSYRASIVRRRRGAMEESLRTGQAVATEVAITRKDGSVCYAVAIVTATREREIAIYNDITDRKKAEMALQESYAQLRRSVNNIIDAILTIVEIRDPFTAGHQKKVSRMAAAIARRMGLSDGVVESIRIAALLHDVGKIYIPGELLSKPGRLTAVESQFLKRYPQASYDILKGIAFPWPVAQIALQHQERFNGSGYPHGLAGDRILLEARILAVADTLEAMTAHRPYRSARAPEAAMAELRKQKGVLFDPAVVDAAVSLYLEQGLEQPAH